MKLLFNTVSLMGNKVKIWKKVIERITLKNIDG